MKRLLLSAVAALAFAAPVLAQDHSGHGGHDMGDSAATTGYKAANTTMHEQMDIDYSGNADIDFVRGMIPHHQGAIDMAKVVIAHGSDPEIRKLAEEVIAAQESEIAWMQQWLAAHPQ